MPQFVQDVEEIRQRAIHKIEEGPVTGAYQLDPEDTISILNEALATEIVCVLRYMHHYFMATGVHGKSVAGEFKEHADAEREHADRIAERIQQLGGKPDFNPRTLVERSSSQYVEGETLAAMIREDLIAERVVIDVYSQMIRYFGEKDPTTRVLIEEILSDEEEHAADLADLLFVVDPKTGQTEGVDPGTNPLAAHSSRGTAAAASGERGRPVGSARERQKEVAPREGRTDRLSGPRGITNAEATRQLEQGELAREARRRSSAARPGDDRGESRPARATGEQRPAAGRGRELAPAHPPGTTGRPPRKGAEPVEAEVEEVRSGLERGASRSAHVTNPTRKQKSKRVA